MHGVQALHGLLYAVNEARLELQYFVAKFGFAIIDALLADRQLLEIDLHALSGDRVLRYLVDVHGLIDGLLANELTDDLRFILVVVQLVLQPVALLRQRRLLSLLLLERVPQLRVLDARQQVDVHDLSLLQVIDGKEEALIEIVIALAIFYVCVEVHIRHVGVVRLF